MQTNQTSPLVLRAAADGEGKPLPLGLEGYPTEADGVPIHYRRAKIARCAEWTHRGTGEPVSITRERVDAWIKNTRALSAAGIKPFLPNRHTSEPSAADNNGYVLDVSRDGDDVYAVLALYGDDARQRAAINGRSIYVVSNARDASGKVHEGESIAHVALVPNPALPDLGPTVTIAASSGGVAVEAPVLIERSIPMFKPETLTKLRAKFKLPDTAPEADVAEKAAAAALVDPPADQSAEVTRLSADVTKLTKERDDAKAEAQRATLALSADKPKEPDALTLSLTLDAFNTKREQAIASGVISEAGAKAIDAILLPGGKPSSVALALSGDGATARPLYVRLMDIIAANPGVKTNNPVPRPQGDGGLRLSADGNADPAKTVADAQAEALKWQQEQLRMRGLQTA